uniref:Uncharacterized protein TCIL3000_11_11840 n=1 Tax=Trypanosoma congolense (strain IL3000) TaxID=1068625 RepID=G0V220_TRYCI|nr:unnamed protein product [Trypanosoma congolense IL3000]
MSVKVWVKLSGAADEEAIGIYATLDETVLDVLEACRDVFRLECSSLTALRIVNGNIIPSSSPVVSLSGLTLEIVRLPPSRPPVRRRASCRPIRGKQEAQKTALGKEISGYTPATLTPFKCKIREVARDAEKWRKPDVSTLLHKLWDSLPAAALERMERYDGSSTHTLLTKCAAQVDFRSGTCEGRGACDCVPLRHVVPVIPTRLQAPAASVAASDPCNQNSPELYREVQSASAWRCDESVVFGPENAGEVVTLFLSPAEESFECGGC